MIGKDEVAVFAKKCMREKFRESLERFQGDLEKEESLMRKTYLPSFDALFKKCMEFQRAGRKEAAAYVHIFYLNTALLTENFELQLNIFSKDSYFDKTECMELCNVNFLMKYFKDDMEYFEKKAYREVVDFDYADLMNWKRSYYKQFISLINLFFLREITHIVELKLFQEMEKQPDIKIAFGGYMDSAFLIWPKESEKNKGVEEVKGR